MVFLHCSRVIGAAVLGAMLVAAPAQAAQIVFEGSGSATSLTTFSGAPTGTIKTGDKLTFRITFDPAGAPLISNQGPTTQVFAPAISKITASIGGFTFVHHLAVPFPSAVVLATGFTFVPGQPSSQPTLIQQFSFSGLPTVGSPFAGGDSLSFSLTSFFPRDLGGAAPTLVDLTDPAFATRNSFQILVRNSGRPIGVVSGDFTGSFAAAVPEPGTWALLILGFATVGGAMRGRRSPRLSVA